MKKYVVYSTSFGRFSPRQSLLTRNISDNIGWEFSKKKARKFSYNLALATMKHLEGFFPEDHFGILVIEEVKNEDL